MISSLINIALQEDLGDIGDLTSLYFIDEKSRSKAVIASRSDGVISGVSIAMDTIKAVDPSIKAVINKNDADKVSPGDVIMTIEGATRSILAAERTALNFLQHLSGVASLTAQFVALAQKAGARIVDTRKTLPGWRALQKQAVVHGGGHNHRMGLYDRILVKDNHLAAVGKNPQQLHAIIKKIRSEQRNILIEFEADTVEDAVTFAEIGADTVLLDNMSPDQLTESVKLIGKRARTEASGGVTLQTVEEISQTGVDDISIGALTHSATSLDIGLDFL